MLTKIRCLLFAIAICFLAVPATCVAQEQSNSLSELLSSETADYGALLETLKERSVSDLIKLANVARPIPSKDRAAKMVEGWSTWTATDESGTERPYQIYLSKSLADGKKPVAVIMHLHGAVGRPDFGEGLGAPQAVGYGAMLWQPVADEEDFLVICPQAKTDCAWWTDAGVDHVQAVLRDVRRMIDVPNESIFATGFSDGASGCYYLATVAPDPFAGFIAMNGHPVVAANASNKQIYLRNLANTPIIAAMTQQDSLYPSSSVLPHITGAIQSGASIHVISYPLMNHQPSYFPDQKFAFVSFVKTKKRVPAARTLWMASSIDTGSVQNVELTKLGARAGDRSALRDVNPMSSPGRVRLGVQLPATGGQAEAKLVEVVNDTVASKAGLESGDVVLKFDGTEVANADQLRRMIRGKRYGDKFNAVVRRGDEEVDVDGQFPVFESRPAYRRDDPTSFIDVRFAASELAVNSANVQEAVIWLPPTLVGSDEIAVTWNGSKKTYPVKTMSSEEWLARFSKTGDRNDLRFEYVELK